MIWEQNISIIAMLTALCERGKVILYFLFYFICFIEKYRRKTENIHINY